MDKNRLPIILESTLPSKQTEDIIKIRATGEKKSGHRRAPLDIRVLAVTVILALGAFFAFLGAKNIPPLSNSITSPVFSFLLKFSFPYRSTDPAPVIDQTEDSSTERTESTSEVESAHGATTQPSYETDTNAESTTETQAESQTANETDTEKQFLSADMSMWELGAAHLDNTTIFTPDVRALLEREHRPISAVLIITSHPDEGYSNGGSVGEVAALLEGALSESGIQALFAQPPNNTDSNAVVNYYLNLYPEIGLILDLRRSAELSDGGKLLRPVYSNDKIASAQMRIICDSRGEGSYMTESNLSLALKLRERIFSLHPSASRPVWLREGTNFCASDTYRLTVEIGAAGNTYSEAQNAVCVLADALAALMTKT
jgi:hypothetical protein